MTEESWNSRLKVGQTVRTPAGDVGTLRFIGKTLSDVEFGSGETARFPNAVLDVVKTGI